MSTHAIGQKADTNRTSSQRWSTKFWELAYKRGAMSENERMASIKAGLDVIWADAARTVFAISAQHMGELLNVSVSTYDRRRKDAKPLNPVASERLDRIAGIALLAKDVFEDKAASTRWMSTPNHALGGRAPVMLCETEIGARQVRRVLNALEWGGVA